MVTMLCVAFTLASISTFVAAGLPIPARNLVLSSNAKHLRWRALERAEAHSTPDDRNNDLSISTVLHRKRPESSKTATALGVGMDRLSTHTSEDARMLDQFEGQLQSMGGTATLLELQLMLFTVHDMLYKAGSCRPYARGGDGSGSNSKFYLDSDCKQAAPELLYGSGSVRSFLTDITRRFPRGPRSSTLLAWASEADDALTFLEGHHERRQHQRRRRRLLQSVAASPGSSPLEAAAGEAAAVLEPRQQAVNASAAAANDAVRPPHTDTRSQLRRRMDRGGRSYGSLGSHGSLGWQRFVGSEKRTRWVRVGGQRGVGRIGRGHRYKDSDNTSGTNRSSSSSSSSSSSTGGSTGGSSTGGGGITGGSSTGGSGGAATNVESGASSGSSWSSWSSRSRRRGLLGDPDAAMSGQAGVGADPRTVPQALEGPQSPTSGLPLVRRVLLAQLLMGWLSHLDRQQQQQQQQLGQAQGQGQSYLEAPGAEEAVKRLVTKLYVTHVNSVTSRAGLEYFHISKSGGTSWTAAAVASGCKAPMYRGGRTPAFDDHCRWVDPQVLVRLGMSHEQAARTPVCPRYGTIVRQCANASLCSCEGRAAFFRRTGLHYTSNEYTLHDGYDDMYSTRLCPQFVNVMTIREPLSRLVSNIKYVLLRLPREQGAQTEGFRRALCNASASLWEVLSPPLADNYNIRTLVGERAFHSPLYGIGDAHEALARALTLQFDLVLDLDSGPEAARLLMQEGLGWNSTLADVHIWSLKRLAERGGVNLDDCPMGDVSPLLVRQQHDIRWYSFARTLARLDVLFLSLTRRLGLQPGSGSGSGAVPLRARRDAGGGAAEGGNGNGNGDEAEGGPGLPACGLLGLGTQPA